MRRLIVLTISFAVLAATQIVVHAELPNPPTKTELEDAVTQIRTVLQQDYLAAKTPDNRIGLARKLLELAAETNDAPVTRYALLIEARDLAANSGNAQIPLESIHMLARLHRVDVTEEQVAVLGLASRLRTSWSSMPTCIGTTWSAGSARSRRRLRANQAISCYVVKLPNNWNWSIFFAGSMLHFKERSQNCVKTPLTPSLLSRWADSWHSPKATGRKGYDGWRGAATQNSRRLRNEM